jgi:hypothetical protein
MQRFLPLILVLVLAAWVPEAHGRPAETVEVVSTEGGEAPPSSSTDIVCTTLPPRKIFYNFNFLFISKL